MKDNNCILALDLGTTAFKCAPVSARGVIGRPAEVRYRLDYDAGRVTCPADRYVRAARQALAAGAAAARAAGSRVRAIGIGSQAQTFLALDRAGHPLQPAVVWTDNRATREARIVARAIPDFARHSGFSQPLGLLFLPKVIHAFRGGMLRRERVGKLLLLNEFIIRTLTGHAYGDEVNQGMSGFYDISRRCLSKRALALAGIKSAQLAETGPAAAISRPLTIDAARRIGLPSPVPVFSCGNDQGCGAAGANLAGTQDILCNFGTAMVVYSVRTRLPSRLAPNQIAGIDPLTDRYFLLGVENECGNIIDWARAALFPSLSIDAMLRRALACECPAKTLPEMRIRGNGRFDLGGLTPAADGAIIVRAILAHFGHAFAELVRTTGGRNTRRAIISGGLARSPAWCAFVGACAGLPTKLAPTEHLGLLGIMRIIERRQRILRARGIPHPE